MISIPKPENYEWRDAAVLIPYYEKSGDKHIVLTRRTDKVGHHKGQIAFPGGAADPEDETLWDTATRETEEEIGIPRRNIELVKKLRPQVTPTGFHVTPFVGKIEAPRQWHLNPIEIAELFTVPLTHLLDPKNLEIRTIEFQGREYPDPHFSYGDRIIWGMTGRVLFEFLELA